MNLAPSDSKLHIQTVLPHGHTSLLSQAIYETCVERTPSPDPNRIIRLAVKTFCLIVSAGAKAPYIPISLTLPGGPAFAFGNTTSFFILEWWAIRATIDEALGARGKSESLLIKRGGRGALYQLATLTGALAISIFPQIPIALPALDYDGQFKVPGFIVLLGAGVFIPIRSLQLTVDNVLKKMLIDQTGKKLQQARLSMMGLIQEYRDIFRQSSLQDKMEKILELDSIRGQKDLTAYIQKVFKPKAIKPVVQESKICKRVSFVAGAMLTAAFEAALVMYTWEKTEEHFIDNEVAAGAIAIATGISWLYLTGQAIIGTTQRVSQAVVNLIKGRKDPSIASQIYPKLTFTLNALGLINTVLALGPTVVIWGEFYESNRYEQVAVEIVMCSSLFLLLSTATLDIIQDFMQQIIQKKGLPNEKLIAELDLELQKFQGLLKESALPDIAAFIMDIPEDLRETLLTKAELTSEVLESYLESQPLLLGKE
ncbi:hypothetical protein [Rhabdochlamydiaceae symbiont of Dictyostelium giganteum]|uniref:hypothetical protein n=1 Tax=Rhabdochlamydiaceae symbiont of Dictyostelium giganteum TaxID=3342349 RepID=UPI00384B6A69